MEFAFQERSPTGTGEIHDFAQIRHRAGHPESRFVRARAITQEAAAKSNEVLRQLGTDIQWVESYVATDKTFCVYLAKDEAVIRRHEQMSEFPATTITEVQKMIDPTTERAD